MVVVESEMNSQGEVESPLQTEQQGNNKNHPLMSSLGRESSIYSLTLDEFQHTLCESGKNFGSMNMDEFLSSIWSAEENQAINNNNNLSLSETSIEKGIRKLPSLPRQGSLTIPAPLCRKTVEEVWSEIHKEQQSQQHNDNRNNSGSVRNTDSTPRQRTFGEMTLEDFLVKAGVVREPCENTMPAVQAAAAAASSLHHHQLQQQYGMYPNNNNLTVGPLPSFRPVMGIGGGGNVVAQPYQAVAQGGGGGAIGESNKRDGGGYPPPGVCYGGRGGYGTNMGMGGAPVSPVSPDGIGGGENSGGQFGMEMSVFRGRKRMLGGPVERVVERRQRRMIKNRESAARSRARKQAYTVELEAELNQLKEENVKLKLALAELERRRKQKCSEEVFAQKAKRKLRSLRRILSCPL